MTLSPPTRLGTAVLTLLLLATSPLAGARAADDVVTAHLDWGGGPPVASLPGTLELSFSARKDVAAPAGTGDVRYGAIPVPAAPGGVVEVVVDLEPRNERIWIDTDLDGQVGDERPLRWQRTGLKWFAGTSVRIGEGPAAVDLPVSLWRGAFRAEDEFLYSASAHRWGAAPVGAALVMVSLEDVDGDLRFTAEAGDRVYVDLDGDGRFDARPGAAERLAPGGFVELGGVRRRIDVEADGGVVRFVADDTPVSDPVPRAGRKVSPPDETFDRLFAQLEKERALPAAERRRTLRAIGALGTTEASVLLDHVARNDLDSDARVMATEALGNPAYLRGGSKRLVALARSSSSRVVTAAIRALHTMGHPERTAIYDGLLDATDVRIVEEAARYLSAAGHSTARAAILRGVTELPGAAMRLAAYRGACSGPHGVPVQARLAAAADAGATLRLLAMRDCLDANDSRARKLLHAAAADLSPRDDGEALLPLLARGGDRVCVDELIRIGATRNPAVASELLVRMHDAVTASRLGAALAEGDTQVRAFAAQVLGLRGDPRAIGRLLAQLEKEVEGFVRSALLVALSDLGEPRTITALARSSDADGGGGPRAVFSALATPWVRGVPESVSAFRIGLREDHWRMRELALQTVAAAGETGVLREVRDALRDKNRNVRAAAAATLGEVRERDSVRPLLVLLRSESSQKVRDAIGLALFRLTGVNLYDDAALWQQWWADKGKTFAVPAKMPALPPAAVAGTRAPEPPKFYGIPLDTESVVFVIDQSGSMSGSATGGSKFGTAVHELLAAVRDLEDGSLVNVILFETGVRSWRQGMQRVGKSTRTSLRRFLAKQSPDGSTNLYDAVARALRIDGVETIVVLSDGEPTHGRYTGANDILDAVGEINERRGVIVHCVSIGGGSTLLRRLAAQNDGQYVTR